MNKRNIFVASFLSALLLCSFSFVFAAGESQSVRNSLLQIIFHILSRDGKISIDGSCGSAAGKSISVAPVSDLCFFGKASSVTGSGPWSWNCSGSGKGKIVKCETGVTKGSGIAITSPTAGSVLNQGASNTATWTGSVSEIVSYSVCLAGGSISASECKSLGTVIASQNSFTWTVPSDVATGEEYQLVFKSSGHNSVFSPSFVISAAIGDAVLDKKEPQMANLEENDASQESDTTTIDESSLSQMSQEELIKYLTTLLKAL